jgi:excisionase family DNA binding protein
MAATKFKKPVSTREAAEILGMSMGHVRGLARKGLLDGERFGPTLMFEEAAVREYGREKTAGRKKGRIRGATPQGFSPDVPGGK